jgi:hypothetical protein
VLWPEEAREKRGQQIGFWMPVLPAEGLHAGQGDGLVFV